MFSITDRWEFPYWGSLLELRWVVSSGLEANISSEKGRKPGLLFLPNTITVCSYPAVVAGFAVPGLADTIHPCTFQLRCGDSRLFPLKALQDLVMGQVVLLSSPLQGLPRGAVLMPSQVDHQPQGTQPALIHWQHWCRGQAFWVLNFAAWFGLGSPFSVPKHIGIWGY